MTSYGSPGMIEYSLNKRHLPRSQVEAIPVPDDYISDDDTSSVNPSSLRANFLPPNAEYPELDPTTIDRYGSLREHSPFFSPVFANLPSVSPAKLQVASVETQNLRRKLLRGANVLIIQGGYSGKKFVYQRLKELGVNVYILDGPDSVWRKAAEEGFIVDFIELDFTENETIYHRAMEAIIDSDIDVKFDAVTTYYEDAVALAARIATTMGLQTNSVDACDRARNKRRTREVMAERRLPVPRFQKVLNEKDIAGACEYVGFPAILKPVYGASSMGVVKALSTEEAEKAYRKLVKTFDVQEDTIWAQGTEMVVEEFYDGDEFDIDLLLSDGVVVYAKDKQAELIKLAVDATLALDFRWGCFHVECKYTSRGPRLIEINARMGGVSVRDVNLYAWGVDLVEEHAMASLKIPIRPVIPAKPLQFMAEAAINAPYSGTMNADNWLDYTLSNPLVHKVNYFRAKGDKVGGPEDGLPDWICEIVVVSNKSQEESVNLIREIITTAKVPITPTIPSKQRGFFFPDHAHPFC